MEVIRQAVKIVVDTYREDTEEGDYVSMVVQEDEKRQTANIYIGTDEVERVYGFYLHYVLSNDKQSKRLCIKLYNWLDYDMMDSGYSHDSLKSLYVDPLDSNFEDVVEGCTRTLYLVISKDLKESKLCRVVLDKQFYARQFDELLKLREEINDVRKLLPKELRDIDDVKQVRNLAMYVKEVNVCKK